MTEPTPDRFYINGAWYLVAPGSYQELDPAQFAHKQYEGDPRYSAFVNLSTFAQDDFSGGYGKRRYGLSDSDERRDRTYRVENVDTSHRGFVCPAFRVESVSFSYRVGQFLEFRGALYCATSGGVYKQTDFDNNTWTCVLPLSMPTVQPSAMAVFSGTTGTPTLYLAPARAGLGFFYSSDGQTWSNQSTTYTVAFFRAAGGDGSTTGAELLLLGAWPNTVRSSADGSTFGSPYYIGDADSEITSLFDFDDYWFVGKKTGMFVIFSNGRVKPLTREVLRSELNCRAVTSWGNLLWYNIGQGLHVFTGGQLLNLGAEESLRFEEPSCDEGELSGEITCLCGAHPRWLFAVLKTLSGKHYLCKYDGDPERGRGWHPIWTPGGTAEITALYWHQPPGAKPRLMMGIWDPGGGGAIAYMTFSDLSEDGIMDPACKFQSYGWVELPAHALNLPNIEKAYVSFYADVQHRYIEDGAVVLGADPTGETFVDLIYSVDDGSERTLARVRDTGLIYRTFPVPTTGRWMRLKLGLGSDDTSGEKFPIVRLVLVEQELIMRAKREWQMTLIVAEGAGADRREARGTLKQLADLDVARGAGPVDITTLRGERLMGIVCAAPKYLVSANEAGGLRTAIWRVPVNIREYGPRQVLYYIGFPNCKFGTATFA